MQFLASEISVDYYTRRPEIGSLLRLTITYIQATALHVHTQSWFNNDTMHRLYRSMGMATIVMGVMKMGNKNYYTYSAQSIHHIRVG